MNRSVPWALFAGSAFVLAPTPLWTHYRQLLGLTDVEVTTIFALYGGGVLAGLLVGPASCRLLGARRVVRFGLLICLLAAADFVVSADPVGLLVARTASGLGLGLLSAAAAHVLADGPAGARALTAATHGGVATGALGSGLVVEPFPWPLVTPYVLAAAGMAVADVAVGRVPAPARHECSPAPPVAKGDTRRSAPLVLVSGLLGAFATNWVFGTVTVNASHLVLVQGLPADGIVAGALVAVMQLCGGLGQLAVGRRTAAGPLPVLCFAAGVGVVVISVFCSWPAPLFGGVAMVGLGGGILLRRAFAAGAFGNGWTRRAPALAFYSGMSLPVVGGGWLADRTGLAASIALSGLGAVAVAVASRLVHTASTVRARPSPLSTHCYSAAHDDGSPTAALATFVVRPPNASPPHDGIQPMDTQKVKADILELEDRRYQAMVDNDTKALQELLSDELVYTHSNATRDTKHSYLDKVTAGFFVYHSVEHPVETLVVRDGLAVLTGQMRARVTNNGVERQLDNACLAVWAKEGEDWKFVAYQPTPNQG
ncbi:MFS transporter [Pseudonocardia lutea]|uniref:MFS transporter n=1 Tax=Pseudonocardia lutea TaxID=2172015 RepID=A0ABW1I181_9PSEU